MKSLNPILSKLIALLFFSTLLLTACHSTTISATTERTTACEECLVVPVSGELEDLNFGFYYDQEIKKCTRIEYSSGGTGAPFLSMEECLACCEKIKNN